MGLDIWFSSDVRNVLSAANQASAATSISLVEALAGQQTSDVQLQVFRAYREGYKAALTTVALAFGVPPQAIGLPPEQVEIDTEEESCGNCG